MFKQKLCKILLVGDPDFKVNLSTKTRLKYYEDAPAYKK